MGETRRCPLCDTVMTYDSATDIYNCPTCGYKEHNQVLNTSSDVSTKG